MRFSMVVWPSTFRVRSTTWAVLIGVMKGGSTIYCCFRGWARGNFFLWFLEKRLHSLGCDRRVLGEWKSWKGRRPCHLTPVGIYTSKVTINVEKVSCVQVLRPLVPKIRISSIDATVAPRRNRRCHLRLVAHARTSSRWSLVQSRVVCACFPVRSPSGERHIPHRPVPPPRLDTRFLWPSSVPRPYSVSRFPTIRLLSGRTSLGRFRENPALPWLSLLCWQLLSITCASYCWKEPSNQRLWCAITMDSKQVNIHIEAWIWKCARFRMASVLLILVIWFLNLLLWMRFTFNEACFSDYCV